MSSSISPATTPASAGTPASGTPASGAAPVAPHNVTQTWNRRRGEREKLRFAKDHPISTSEQKLQGEDQCNHLQRLLTYVDENHINLFGLKRLAGLDVNGWLDVRGHVLKEEDVSPKNEKIKHSLPCPAKSAKRLRQLRRNRKWSDVHRQAILAAGEVTSVLAYAALSGSAPIVNSLLHAGATPFLLGESTRRRLEELETARTSRRTPEMNKKNIGFEANQILRKRLHDCFAVYVVESLARNMVPSSSSSPPSSPSSSCGKTAPSSKSCGVCGLGSLPFLFRCSSRTPEEDPCFFCEACFWTDFVTTFDEREPLLRGDIHNIVVEKSSLSSFSSSTPGETREAARKEKKYQDFIACPCCGYGLRKDKEERKEQEDTPISPRSNYSTTASGSTSASPADQSSSPSSDSDASADDPSSGSRAKSDKDRSPAEQTSSSSSTSLSPRPSSSTCTTASHAAASSLTRFVCSLPREILGDFKKHPDYAKLKAMSNNYTSCRSLSLYETKFLNVGCVQADRTVAWLEAVKNRDLLRMRALFTLAVDVDAGCFEYGATALMQACSLRWSRGVQALVEEFGATKHTANNGLLDGYSALRRFIVLDKREGGGVRIVKEDDFDFLDHDDASDEKKSEEMNEKQIISSYLKSLDEEGAKANVTKHNLETASCALGLRDLPTTFSSTPKMESFVIPYLLEDDPSSLLARRNNLLSSTAFIIDGAWSPLVAATRTPAATSSSFLDYLRHVFNQQIAHTGAKELCAERRYFWDVDGYVQSHLEAAVRRSSLGATPSSNSTSVLTFGQMRFLHYPKKGGAVGTHQDLCRADAKSGRRSTHTFILYFDLEEGDRDPSSAYEVEDAGEDRSVGGETSIFLSDPTTSTTTRHQHQQHADSSSQTRNSVDVLPLSGRLLLFPHKAWHEGLAVKRPPKVLLRGEIGLFCD
ncbi:unnamed protein product [Amoebophrya sp. A25]|nr:unnamed protein product [Amoebophrya sp. A25]|eukprot:GSA25T00008571001.1